MFFKGIREGCIEFEKRLVTLLLEDWIPMKSGTMMAYISRMCSQFSHFPRKICSKLYIHVCFIFSNISEEFIRRFIYVFFLQNTIDFRFVQGLGQQKMSGSVSDVVITSASFDKERRASTKSRVKLYSFYLRL